MSQLPWALFPSTSSRASTAVFPARDFGTLVALRGDEGAASFLRSAPGVVGVQWWEGEIDIDTPEDLIGRAGMPLGETLPDALSMSPWKT